MLDKYNIIKIAQFRHDFIIVTIFAFIFFYILTAMYHRSLTKAFRKVHIEMWFMVGLLAIGSLFSLYEFYRHGNCEGQVPFSDNLYYYEQWYVEGNISYGNQGFMGQPANMNCRIANYSFVENYNKTENIIYVDELSEVLMR